MIEPIRISFDVDRPTDHAFDVWTAQIGRWWPADHTTTGEPGLVVTMEPRVGGRIYERTVEGHESDWGRILVWEPPERLVYSWHLKREPDEATEVEIRFVATAPASTRVEIEHRGWERLGSDGPPWRDRNRGGWETLLPHYVDALAATEVGG
jgi:uncharacterized protein YndB with AHSA1/START domain